MSSYKVQYVQIITPNYEKRKKKTGFVIGKYQVLYKYL